MASRDNIFGRFKSSRSKKDGAKGGSNAEQAFPLELTSDRIAGFLEELEQTTVMFVKGVDQGVGTTVPVRIVVTDLAVSLTIEAMVSWRRPGKAHLKGGIGASVDGRTLKQIQDWISEYAPSRERKKKPKKASTTLLHIDAVAPEKKAERRVRVEEQTADTDVGSQLPSSPSIEMVRLPEAGLATARLVNPKIGEFVAAKYECLERIGRGGTSVIYSARNRALGKKVALKLIHEDLPERQLVSQLFYNEAQILASIETFSIPMVIDFGVDTHFGPYFVMEHLRGQTLATWLLREEPEMNLSKFYRLALELAVAMDSVHSAGIIHCDLKPENLWISREENIRGVRHYIKMFDFGISRSNEGSEHQPDHVAGTPEFMAPEQIRGKELDHRTDLYALGVIFYELLTGDVPFRGDSVEEILYGHLEQTVLPVNEARSEPVDIRLDALVAQLLAKDPDLRPESAAEVYHTLAYLRRVHRKKRSEQTVDEEFQV